MKRYVVEEWCTSLSHDHLRLNTKTPATDKCCTVRKICGLQNHEPKQSRRWRRGFYPVMRTVSGCSGTVRLQLYLGN